MAPEGQGQGGGPPRDVGRELCEAAAALADACERRWRTGPGGAADRESVAADREAHVQAASGAPQGVGGDAPGPPGAAELAARVARVRELLRLVVPPTLPGGYIADPALVFPQRPDGSPGAYLRRFCGACRRELTRWTMVLQVEGSDAEVVAMPAVCPLCSTALVVTSPIHRAGPGGIPRPPFRGRGGPIVGD